MSTFSSDTRTALLEAAILCFTENGYSGTSMRMIATRAQRPFSLITHHFGTKEALYVEVFKHIFQNVLRKNLNYQTLPEGVYPRNKNEAIRILREAYHAIYREVSFDPDPSDHLRNCWPKLWMQEAQAPRTSLHELLKEHFGPLTTTICKCVRVLRADLDNAEVNLLTTSVLGIVISHGFMRGVNRVIFGDQDQFPESTFKSSEILMNLCLHGLLNHDLGTDFR